MHVDWPFEFPGAYLDGSARRKTRSLTSYVTARCFATTVWARRNMPMPTKRPPKEFYGVQHALGINSGTGALIASLTRVGNRGPGCEVIVPAFLWVASIGAVVQVNAIPVLCEVDDSLCMDSADLEKKITPRTKLILPIHMAGSPCNMTAIMAIAKKHGIPVLEDCAQANGWNIQGPKTWHIWRHRHFQPATE